MKNERILMIYYSRSGYTKQVAEDITKELNCRIEEIQEVKRKKGVLGWLGLGKDGLFKTKSLLKETGFDIRDYSLVIIGTPRYVNMAPAIRSFITENRQYMHRVACFVTSGETRPKQVLDEIERISGLTLLAGTGFVLSDFKNRKVYQKKLNQFISDLAVSRIKSHD